MYVCVVCVCVVREPTAITAKKKRARKRWRRQRKRKEGREEGKKVKRWRGRKRKGRRKGREGGNDLSPCLTWLHRAHRSVIDA